MSNLMLLLLLAFACLTIGHAAPTPTVAQLATTMPQNEFAAPQFMLKRTRRQFDLKLSAEHDDEEDETEIALEAIANLWRSSDGNTQVEGSAKVVHRSNTLESGKTRFSANLHVHHDYKRKK